MKVLLQNKKARHDYFIIETMEAGVELRGTEVKSLRAARANLKDSYVEIKNGEAFLLGMHVSPYEQGNLFNCDPLRPRRLLLHKREINKLFGLVKQEGYTLVPLSLYFSGSHIKVELAVAKGKKLYDKRETQAKHDARRQMERALKNRE